MALKARIQTTSAAWMNLVQPPGTIYRITCVAAISIPNHEPPSKAQLANDEIQVVTGECIIHPAIGTENKQQWFQSLW